MRACVCVCVCVCVSDSSAHLDSTQELVEEIGHAIVIQLNANDTTQVGIHQLHHYVAEEVGRERERREAGECREGAGRSKVWEQGGVRGGR